MSILLRFPFSIYILNQGRVHWVQPAVRTQTGLLNVLAGGGPSLSVVLPHQVWGSLGANAVSSIAAGIGIFILTINLKSCWAYMYNCWNTQGDDFCFVACFSTVCISCGMAKILGLYPSKSPPFPFPLTPSSSVTSIK